MTREEALARASASYDAAVAEAHAVAVELLVARGFDEDEVVRAIARWELDQVAPERAAMMAKLGRWLDEPDAGSFELH